DEYGDFVAAWVRKPFTDQDVAAALTAVSEAPLVLIVEDDQDLARVIAASLENQGMRTVWAANGVEAVEACGALTPALVVLDLVLPELDGFALVTWMRKSNVLDHVPLLVYSATEVSAADQPRLTLGPTEFLTKSRNPMSTVADRAMSLLRAGARKEMPDAA
ncbi:MAG: response regulator, partial [Acidobacteriota bacterium]